VGLGSVFEELIFALGGETGFGGERGAGLDVGRGGGSGIMTTDLSGKTAGLVVGDDKFCREAGLVVGGDKFCRGAGLDVGRGGGSGIMTTGLAGMDDKVCRGDGGRGTTGLVIGDVCCLTNGFGGEAGFGADTITTGFVVGNGGGPGIGLGVGDCGLVGIDFSFGGEIGRGFGGGGALDFSISFIKCFTEDGDVGAFVVVIGNWMLLFLLSDSGGTGLGIEGVFILIVDDWGFLI
jgi:hypothetical protein